MTAPQDVPSTPPPVPADGSALIHLDNAATSFPKPPAVADAITRLLAGAAVSPGRSGFDLGRELGELVDEVRARLDRLFANPADDPNRTVFTANATDAINLALRGLCPPGSHVVATVMDHNAVLRPLWMLREAGHLTFDLAPADARGRVAPGAVADLIRPETRVVVMTHASNVCGTVQPIAAIGAACRARGVPLLLDAAQTAGVLPIDMGQLGCDLVAFTGHKSLLGPTGIGGLVVGPDVELHGSRWGGTGVRSAERAHLPEYPYRLEAGTLNTVGIVGLGASLAWLAARGMADIRAHEQALAARFLAGLAPLAASGRIRVAGYRPDEPLLPAEDRLAVVSVTAATRDPAAVGEFLDADWNIAARTGLQCAPLAHDALGTAPDGTVRFSFGPFNTPAHVDRAVAALAAIAG